MTDSDRGEGVMEGVTVSEMTWRPLRSWLRWGCCELLF